MKNFGDETVTIESIIVGCNTRCHYAVFLIISWDYGVWNEPVTHPPLCGDSENPRDIGVRMGVEGMRDGCPVCQWCDSQRGDRVSTPGEGRCAKLAAFLPQTKPCVNLATLDRNLLFKLQYRLNRDGYIDIVQH